MRPPIGEEGVTATPVTSSRDDNRYRRCGMAFTMLKEQLEDVSALPLTDREQKVLRLRFGLDDGRARTLEEVERVMLQESVSVGSRRKRSVNCAIRAVPES